MGTGLSSRRKRQARMHPMRPEHVQMYKILVLGDAGVGKSQLLNRLLYGKFSETSIPDKRVTIGVKIIQMREPLAAGMQVWDIPSRFLADMGNIYLSNAHGAVIVCDVTRHESLQAIPRWVTELRRLPGEGRLCPWILLANKCDRSDRVVGMDEMKDLEHKWGGASSFEVSARADEAVDTAFATLMQIVLARTTPKEVVLDDHVGKETRRSSVRRDVAECTSDWRSVHSESSRSVIDRSGHEEPLEEVCKSPHTETGELPTLHPEMEENRPADVAPVG